MSTRRPANVILRVEANKARSEIEIVYVANGEPVASVVFTQEQAEKHALAVVEAIEIVNGSGNKPKIILPH